MTTIADESTVTPSDADSEMAREASRRLASHASSGLCIHVEASDEAIQIPAAAAKLLLTMLSEMAVGNSINLMPIRAELTTQQAADLLSVSRPFLVKQLDEDRIPYRRVGRHRRVLLRDLIRYKDMIDAKRHEALDVLAAQTQELCLDY